MNTAALKHPDISVLIPCYKALATLKRAVQSVIEQPNVTVEVVLVDDASPDDTGTLIDELAQRYANIVTVHQVENRRQGAALNSGMARAQGQYFLRLDQDDWLEPGCLAWLKRALDTSDKAFAYGAMRYHGRRSDLVQPAPFSREEFYRHNASGYCYLFRRDVWEAGIRYEETGTLVNLGDWIHPLDMIQAGFEGLALPDVTVLHYVYGWTGTSNDLKANEGAALEELKRRFPSVKAVSL